MNNMIEKLKKNEKQFVLLSPEEQAFLKSLPENTIEFLLDANYVKWELLISPGFTPMSTYRIKSDYQPKPEYVDLEIVALKCSNFGRHVEWLGVLSVSADFLPFDFTHLHCLPSLPNFDCFWIEDDDKKVVHIAIHHVASYIREGKKVYARFRPE